MEWKTAHLDPSPVLYEYRESSDFTEWTAGPEPSVSYVPKAFPNVLATHQDALSRVCPQLRSVSPAGVSGTKLLQLGFPLCSHSQTASYGLDFREHEADPTFVSWQKAPILPRDSLVTFPFCLLSR